MLWLNYNAYLFEKRQGHSLTKLQKDVLLIPRLTMLAFALKLAYSMYRHKSNLRKQQVLKNNSSLTEFQQCKYIITSIRYIKTLKYNQFPSCRLLVWSAC